MKDQKIEQKDVREVRVRPLGRKKKRKEKQELEEQQYWSAY